MKHTRTTRWPQPFVGMRGIGWADVPREATAGITLAALIIPLNIGFAQVAGLPPVVGLYSAIIPLVVCALFTTSRHVVGSPDASIAALMGAALLAFAAAPGDPLRVQYAGALALMCGLLFFVFWFFRLAFLANFLSRAVLVGFISGLGIEVFTNQVRKILGASVDHGSQVVVVASQASTPVRWFVLDAEAIIDIDATGAKVLHQALRLLADREVTFALARAKPQLPSLLQRYGLLELIGENRLYPTNRHAVAALCSELGPRLTGK